MQRDKGLQRILGDLPFSLGSYNMRKENKSTFLDIGCGFGKPVVHSAMQTGCASYGIEIVPTRVAFCEDMKWVFKSKYEEASLGAGGRPRLSRASSRTAAAAGAAKKRDSSKKRDGALSTKSTAATTSAETAVSSSQCAPLETVE